MGLFDFLRRPEPKSMPGPHNPKLQAALKAHKVAPSPQAREYLLRVLGESIVLVAVQELPEELRGEGPFVLQKDMTIVELTTTNAQGERMGLVFSDHANVQARKKGAPWMSLDAKQAATNVLRMNARGMVVDPAGDWIELTRQELEDLAKM